MCEEIEKGLLDLTQSQYMPSDVDLIRSDNTRRPHLGFNSTKQIHALTNQSAMTQGYNEKMLNVSPFMSMPGHPGTIYGGGGIIDTSGMAGETRDSVIQMYNQMVFDNNNVSEFIEQSQHSQRSVSPQLQKQYLTNRLPSIEKTRKELSFNSARDKMLPSEVINAQNY